MSSDFKYETRQERREREWRERPSPIAQEIEKILTEHNMSIPSYSIKLDDLKGGQRSELIQIFMMLKSWLKDNKGKFKTAHLIIGKTGVRIHPHD